MLACMHPAFDGPMVLFQDIIEDLTGRCQQLSARAPLALSCTMAGE
jgi:hypothetical protein